jgi:hypothetical protein
MNLQQIHKQIQVEPEMKSKLVETNAEDIMTSRPSTRTLMDDIKFNTGKRSLDSVNFIPDSLQPRHSDAYEPQRMNENGPSSAKRLSAREYSPTDYGRYEPRMSGSDPRSTSPRRLNRRSRSRSRSPESATNGNSDRVEDKTVSVKIVNACKVSRFIRTRYGVTGRNIGDVTDMEIDDDTVRSPYSSRNSQKQESNFSMKLKPSSSLSQVKNVAAVKAGLYSDLARSLYMK